MITVRDRSGSGAEHADRLLELRDPVVVAVGEGRDQRDLFHQKGHADGHRLPEAGQDADGPSRADPIGGLVQRALGAGGVEDDVVVGAGRPAGPEPLGGGLGARACRAFTSTDGTQGTGHGDGAQTDGSGPDDQHPRSPATTPARWAPCRATARGSTRQATSRARVVGRGMAHDGSTHTWSASPPSRLIPYMASEDG